MKENKMYDVALSFAGEDREFVVEFAKTLKHNGIDVFYDNFEKHKLVGKNLIDHFTKVYGGELSKNVIIFVSENYKKKGWTKVESNAAFEEVLNRIQQGVDEEFIWPIRFDSTKLPGVPKTIGYIDAIKSESGYKISSEGAARIIIQKLLENNPDLRATSLARV